MSLQTKNRFKKWVKWCGLAVFALVFTLNIQVMFNEEDQISKGNISVAGVELKLFESTYAEDYGSCSDICLGYQGLCTYLIGIGYCAGNLDY